MGKNRTILIVDDEESVRKVMYRWLSEENYACEEADSGERALELLASGIFSLVILDIMMPGISGIEVLEEIREKYPDLAVIMVTAVDDRRTAQQAISLGAYGYIIKPYERNAVLIHIASALRRRALEIDNKRYKDDLEMLVVDRIREVKRHEEEMEETLTEISTLMEHVIVANDFTVRFANPDLQSCVEIQDCKEKKCPSFTRGTFRCWQESGTFCYGKIQGVFTEKYGKCTECPVYKAATRSYKMKFGEHFNNMMHILEAKHIRLQKAYDILKEQTDKK